MCAHQPTLRLKKTVQSVQTGIASNCYGMSLPSKHLRKTIISKNESPIYEPPCHLSSGLSTSMRELEFELGKDPGVVEAGMSALDHQIPTGRGFIDVLCVDNTGAFAVIELKVVEDDSMLLQALDYLDWVNEQIDRLAERYKENEAGGKIDIAKEPRVILVAPRFSERLRRAVKYVTSPVDLFEYEFLKTSSGEKGIHLTAVRIGPVRSPPSPTSIDEHVDYITNEPIRDLCKDIIKRVRGLNQADIELKPTQYYLGFQYQGRNIATINTRRDFFWLSYPSKGEWVVVEIRKSDDFTEEIFGKLREVYLGLKRR